MKNGNSNGTLLLAVQRGDEINVEYSKKEIINKINSYFGYKLLNEIKLQTFTSTVKKPKNKNTIIKATKDFEKKINKIENNSIRNSLSELLKTIKNV